MPHAGAIEVRDIGWAGPLSSGAQRITVDRPIVKEELIRPAAARHFSVDANGLPSVAEWVHIQGPSAPAAASGDAPSAHAHDFADAPKGKVTDPGKKTGSKKVSPTVFGCDRHYGSANVCVPTAFPTEVEKATAARCTWNDHGRLKVDGRDDPLRPDRDRGGVACGKGDLRRR
ncbi:hypothetical protein QFZ56_007780 [Streptomyces achromogenes]|uniref:Uncharacterized protein n=1 Tax=Streptomyces achromogenes TaxID=67255 RepID=A0ABU0QDT5_STRAH|nr:hypothetical protein [Streptomyces achromogenes]